jgi:hypothetical protein
MIASYMPRRKAVWGTSLRLGVGALAATASLFVAGCGDAVRGGTGSSYLVMNTLTGGAGTSGQLSAVLASDVLNVDATTGKQSIASDRGQASFTLQMKDLGGPGPSPANAITLTQYHVEYVRSDGRNVQGVDVPFAFDGAVTLTVTSSGTIGFTLVRIQAKQEAPLQALAFSGGANTISTIARVTFYGHDQTGRGVSVTGQLEVDFSDWAG